MLCPRLFRQTHADLSGSRAPYPSSVPNAHDPIFPGPTRRSGPQTDFPRFASASRIHDIDPNLVSTWDSSLLVELALKNWLQSVGREARARQGEASRKARTG